MAPRSRTGCLTCRSRKLKCTEERPVCAQCAKANRECVPSSGITFRHQQNPSMNADDDGEGSLRNFYGYKETFGRNTTWVDVPTELTFVHTSNPYEDGEDGPGGSGGYGEGDTSLMSVDKERFEEKRRESGFGIQQASYPSYATQGLEALSAVASQGQYNYAPAPPAISQHEHTSPHMASTSPQHQSATVRPDLDYILNPTSSVSPTITHIDPHLQPGTPSTLPSMASPEAFQPKLEHVRSYSSHSYTSSHGLRRKISNLGHERGGAIEDPELAFFLRDYSERIGLWMDIFDLTYFFSTRVPILAIKCPLLLYSCASLSAKGLARVDGRKPKMGGQISDARQCTMEKWPGPPLSGEQRLHRARQYYDVAVSLLRQALSGASKPGSHSLPEEASPNTVSNAQGYPLPRTDSDELIAATAILCVYEFFDVSRPEWSRHLDGAKSLFDIANDRMADITRPPSPIAALAPLIRPLPTSDSSRALLAPNLRAVFWCFARQDMLWAFINHTVTRVDTADLSIWRSAGLKIAPDGFPYPSNSLHPDYLPDQAMQDDMVSNTLIWLLAKLVNLMVAPDLGPTPLSPLSASIRQKDLLDSWDTLDAQLRAWHEGLPVSFSPTAIKVPTSSMEIEEKWFPRPQCASTMQWWHFARIQLLNSRPQGTSQLDNTHMQGGQPAIGSNLAQRHANYLSILKQSRAHAKEIVAIGLGRSDEGTRVHGVQPLWTAGLILGGSEDEEISAETEMWRRNIVSQLRGIEKDMGWASEYRMQSLLQTWHLPPDWGADLPD